MINGIFNRTELSSHFVMYDAPERVVVNTRKSTRYREFSTIKILIEELQRLGPLVADTSLVSVTAGVEKTFWRYFGFGREYTRVRPFHIIVIGAKDGDHGEHIYYVECAPETSEDSSSYKTYRTLNQKVYEMSHKKFFNICEHLYPPKLKK